MSGPSADQGRGRRAAAAVRPRRISGATRVVGVIGDPVAHSLSPALHNAAFAAAGLDWVYVAFPVPAGRAGDAVRAVGALGLAGLNVTMPHKAGAAAACDELTADAAALGSVNTVVPAADGRTLGDCTDGAGFAAALADDGIAVAGRSVLVLGAGGAARAVVLALGRAGAEITVAARRPEAAQVAAALAPGARAIILDAAEASAEVVVNATPLGMRPGDPLPVPVTGFGPGQAVVDLIYHPAETPLLAAARARGALAVNGLGMLVHQAALSFRAWTGTRPDLQAMRAAAAQAVHPQSAAPRS